MIVLPFPPSSLSGHAKGHWRSKSTPTATHREWARLATLASPPRVPEAGDILVHVRFVPPDRRGDRTNFANRLKPYFGWDRRRAARERRSVPANLRVLGAGQAGPGRVHRRRGLSMTPEHLATFASYFNVAPAMLLATLYAAGGRTVSRAELQDGIGIAKSTLTGSAFLLHTKLPSGSVECLTRSGYRLTGVGLDACAFAIAEVAAQPELAPETIPVRKPIDTKPGALWSDAGRLKIRHRLAREGWVA